MKLLTAFCTHERDTRSIDHRDRAQSPSYAKTYPVITATFPSRVNALIGGVNQEKTLLSQTTAFLSACPSVATGKEELRPIGIKRILAWLGDGGLSWLWCVTIGVSSCLTVDSLEVVVIPLYVVQPLYFIAKPHTVGEGRRKRSLIILAIIVEEK